MKILVVTAYPPVLHMHGGGVRMYHNIRLLAERHQVRVLSFVENDDEIEMLRKTAEICDSVSVIRRIPDFRPHWLSIKPFMVREFSTPEMHRAVDALLRSERFDALQCEYLQMAQFRRRGIFSVLTVHEVLSRNAYAAFLKEAFPAEKLRLFYRWMQMLQYEIAQAREFNRVITMTEEDATYLRSYCPAADIRSIPIGIDPEEFRPVSDPDQALTALFVGNFRHSPNLEALRFIVREIAPNFPEVRFLIPGSHVPKDLSVGPNVVFPGYSADIRSLYRSPNTIVLAPLFSGTGQRVKLLEAFSMACPVITTTVGAFGYPVEHGVHAMVANTAEEFAAAMRSLIESQELRCRLGASGREMIRERFTWERIGGELLEAVEHAAGPENLTNGPIPNSQFPSERKVSSPVCSDGNWELGIGPLVRSSALKRLLLPIKAVTFIWRFLILLACTAYLEGSRVTRG